MTDPIHTLGHVKRIDLLGVDLLRGHLIVSVTLGPADRPHHRTLGPLSIAPDAAQAFLRQAAAALETTPPATGTA